MHMRFASVAAIVLFLFGSCKETKTPAESYLTVDPAESLTMESIESTGTLTIETNLPA